MMYVKLPKAVVLYAIDILSESGCCVFQKKDHLYCRGCEVSKCGKGAVHEAEHGAYPLCNEMYAGKHNQDQEHQAVYAGSTV